MNAATILPLISTALDAAEVINSLVIRITEMVNRLHSEGHITHTQQAELLNYMSTRYRVVQGRIPRQPWETVEPDPGSSGNGNYDGGYDDMKTYPMPPLNPGYHQTR